MPVTAGRIFLSYRREEDRHLAGRLADRLVDRFGTDHVFMDVETIEPGADFAVVIEEAVASCQVLIAVVGPKWLHLTNRQGRRKLDDPDDFVALEIRTALDRGIRVIPVLVDGAEMPRSDDLPDRLRDFARRNAARLDHETFRSDLDRILHSVDRSLARVTGPAAVVVDLRKPDDPAGSDGPEPGSLQPTEPDPAEPGPAAAAEVPAAEVPAAEEPAAEVSAPEDSAPEDSVPAPDGLDTEPDVPAGGGAMSPPEPLAAELDRPGEPWPDVELDAPARERIPDPITEPLPVVVTLPAQDRGPAPVRSAAAMSGPYGSPPRWAGSPEHSPTVTGNRSRGARAVSRVRVVYRVVLWWLVFGASILAVLGAVPSVALGFVLVEILWILLLVGLVLLLRSEVRSQRRILDGSGADPLVVESARRAVSRPHLVKVSVACAVVALLIGGPASCASLTNVPAGAASGLSST